MQTIEEQEEHVLYIPTESLPTLWHGFSTRAGLEELLCRSVPRFAPRSQAETDRTKKQIIPYVVASRRFLGHTEYLTYHRGGKGGESRLHGQRSLGFGGHVSSEDANLLNGVEREIREEFPDAASYAWRFVGAINDDTHDAGKVHIGAVFRLMADKTMRVVSPDPAILNPRWVPMQALMRDISEFEPWSQILIQEYLSN